MMSVTYPGSRFNRIYRILIPQSYTFFSGSSILKNSGVKHALARGNFRMGNRQGSLPGCAQVRIKLYKKDLCWFVRLVYDPRELLRVTTIRFRVARVLQIIPELTLMVSQACTGQLKMIRYRLGQGHGYIRMMHRSSRRDMIWYVCC
jgi:hypothetical protein